MFYSETTMSHLQDNMGLRSNTSEIHLCKYFLQILYNTINNNLKYFYTCNISCVKQPRLVLTVYSVFSRWKHHRFQQERK